ncbi:unnamed protein product [Citrullus colocynthis]|uniref:Uncharacterized protein n=1 Tax=Citrullus colocynthis TaxID=252529 RepID=A0ABP0Y398_9ROSI
MEYSAPVLLLGRDGQRQQGFNILDTGNLVLKSKSGIFVWQRFQTGKPKASSDYYNLEEDEVGQTLEVFEDTNSDYTYEGEPPKEGIRACRGSCVNVLTNEHKVLFKVLHFVEDEGIKRTILKTLKESFEDKRITNRAIMAKGRNKSI